MLFSKIEKDSTSDRGSASQNQVLLTGGELEVVTKKEIN